MRILLPLMLALSALSLAVHSSPVHPDFEMEVTATAYTSCPKQTDNTPFLAAWNNELKPGMKAIAVSRDLLNLGLTNGTKVTISGLPGEYVVLDKMNKRWQRKIDIYMGLDEKSAKCWGKRKVVIGWSDDQAGADF